MTPVPIARIYTNEKARRAHRERERDEDEDEDEDGFPRNEETVVAVADEAAAAARATFPPCGRGKRIR